MKEQYIVKTKDGEDFKIEGQYENQRNDDARQLFKDILRECYCEPHHVEFDSIIGHHLSYEAHYIGQDGFKYTVVEEIPSADALIFDHDIARKVWGHDWQTALTKLALVPISEREKVLAEMYYSRNV